MHSDPSYCGKHNAHTGADLHVHRGDGRCGRCVVGLYRQGERGRADTATPVIGMDGDGIAARRSRTIDGAAGRVEPHASRQATDRVRQRVTIGVTEGVELKAGVNADLEKATEQSAQMCGFTRFR